MADVMNVSFRPSINLPKQEFKVESVPPSKGMSVETAGLEAAGQGQAAGPVPGTGGQVTGGKVNIKV